MRQETLNVRGMTCAACAQRIEKVLGRLPGITTASVNLAAETLRVEYEEEKLTLPGIQEAVAKLGYEAVERTQYSTIAIPIGGMTCAACAQRVEKALRGLAGVQTAGVNLATEKATVTYDPRQIRASAIKEAIRKAGYTPLELAQSGAADADRERKRRDIRIMWTKFIVSAVFSLPLLYAAMAPCSPS